MNGAAEQQNDIAAELEDLRQQLERERRGHDIAVDESLGLRDELEQERYARQAAEDRLFKLRQNLNDEDNPKQVAEAAALQQELAQERRARAETEAVTKDLRQQLERARGLYKADQTRINTCEDRLSKLSTSLAVADRDLVQLGQKLEQEQAIRIAVEQQLQTEDKSIPKPSHFLTIAAMLGLLKDAGRSSRNQSAVLAEILERNPNKHGLSKRTLEGIFSDANKAMAGDE
jgi:chromosome segregation ATPase